MLSHVHLGVSDFPRDLAFYERLLPILGLELKFNDPQKPWAGWMRPGVARPLFLIGVPFDRQPTTPGNGQMVALLAPSRQAVDQCHAEALAAGGTDEGAPGLRPEYHPNFYGAYFRDPAGNKLCVCHHDPQ
ncbi:MAG: VOC family protein [Caulobacteraceae bacterium]|nr:VOC family protein [Caulobacteraceae bacterium]